MKVLAHIHTFNDADIVERTVEAVLNQTRPADAVLIVDNGSSDGTVERDFPAAVTVLRHARNQGTAGAVASGMAHALEHGYDWIWTFDADSLVAPDALERLLDDFAGWPAAQQQGTFFLACLPINLADGVPFHGGRLAANGIDLVRPETDQRLYACNIAIWSGCLFRLAAVREVGLPNRDYFVDWDEFELGYRAMRAGYQGYVDQAATLQHNIRGQPSRVPVRRKWGPFSLTFHEFPPLRCYYTCRNMLHFALYGVERRRLGPCLGVARRALRLILNFLLRPRGHGAELRACLRGTWHGLTGNLKARY